MRGLDDFRIGAGNRPLPDRRHADLMDPLVADLGAVEVDVVVVSNSLALLHSERVDGDSRRVFRSFFINIGNRSRLHATAELIITVTLVADGGEDPTVKFLMRQGCLFADTGANPDSSQFQGF